MASTAPSTPMRRRVYSADEEVSTPRSRMGRVGSDGVHSRCSSSDDPQSSSKADILSPKPGTGSRPRLASSDIPRTYSGLYGAGDGAPSIPDFSQNESGTCDENALLSPPRIQSSLSQQSSPSKVRVMPHHPRHHYQAGSNLLPFELSRNRNTDWIAAGGPPLLLTYLSLILIFLLTSLAFVPEPRMAWMSINALHGLVSLIYLHWIKGNPADYMDGTQGEMNAMTLWEQIVSQPANHLHREGAASLGESESSTPFNNRSEKNRSYPPKQRSFVQQIEAGRIRGQGRDVLCVVPTLLALASCYVAKFQFQYAIINVVVWAIVMLPKMPFMNGVRILGINKTTGIDDEDYSFDVDDCLETEDEDWNELDSKESLSVGMDFDINQNKPPEGMDVIPVGTEVSLDEPKKER